MAPPAATYAVIVGIDDYSVYDRSASQAAGTSDLSGAVNDALEWARLCQALGVRSEDIRLHLNPTVESSRLARVVGRGQPMTQRAATRAKVLGSVGWLRERLARSPASRGLLVFAGHGDLADDGSLVLCAADTRLGKRGELLDALSFADLETAVAATGRLVNLTAIIDACHAAGSGEAAPSDRPRVLRRRRAAVVAREHDSFPVFRACQPQQTTYEMQVGAQGRGAFSWSLLRVVQRWGLTPGAAGLPSVTLSHRDAAMRTAALLQALGLEQTPVFTGPRSELDQALFHLRPGDSSSFAAQAPQVLPGRELHPGTYDLVDKGTNTLLGYAVITDGNGAGPAINGVERWDVETAYWFFTAQKNPFSEVASFQIKLHAGASPSLLPSAASLVHPNSSFVAATAASIPALPRWYTWSRVRPGGPTTTQGSLGVQAASGATAWTLAWVSTPELAGTRASLDMASKEYFQFDLAPGGTRLYPNPLMPVALAIDVVG